MIIEVPVSTKHITRYNTILILWKDPIVPMYKWLYDNIPGQSTFNKFDPNEKNWIILKSSKEYVTIGFDNISPEIILMFKLTWGIYENCN